MIKKCVVCEKEFFSKGNNKTCSQHCSKKLLYLRHNKYITKKKEYYNNYWNERIKRLRKENPEFRKKINKRNKNWKLNHPNAQKIYRDKNRKLTNAYADKYYERDKKKLIEFLGSNCIFCGSKKRVCYHQIYGKRHIDNKYYILRHKENFVPLCFNCHTSLHRLSKIENINWKKFFKFRNLLLISKEMPVLP